MYIFETIFNLLYDFMKKFSIIPMAIVACMSIFSCNKPNPETPDEESPKIEVQNSSISAVAQGGDYEISYSIINAVDWVTLSASSEADWITSIESSTYGKVTFTVLPNTTTDQRTAVIQLKYGTVSAKVNVTQEGKEPSEYDVEMEMPLFYGIYYGEYYKEGVGNYWFYLMDQEMVSDVMSPNGNYYRIDLYGAVAEDPANAFVPDGTYTLDLESTCEEWTFTEEYSYLIVTDEAGQGLGYRCTEGVLTVKNEGENCSFELIATIDGKKHRITYNGPAPFTDDSGTDEPDVDYPQITEDITLNVVNADAYWESATDGVACLDIRFMDMEKDSDSNPVYPGVAVDLDLYCILEEDGSIRAGEYVITEDAGAAGTLAPGKISSIIGIMIPSGTNVQQFDEDGNRSFGPVTAGTFTISGDVNEAVVEMNFTMEGNHTLKASYRGPLPVKNIP